MHASAPIRLLIVERQPVLTPEIRYALGDDKMFEEVGHVGSAVDATRLARERGAGPGYRGKHPARAWRVRADALLPPALAENGGGVRDPRGL